MYSDVTYDSIMLFVLLYPISTALAELLVIHTLCLSNMGRGKHSSPDQKHLYCVFICFKSSLICLVQHIAMCLRINCTVPQRKLP